jgi:hypothetical protein
MLGKEESCNWHLYPFMFTIELIIVGKEEVEV